MATIERNNISDNEADDGGGIFSKTSSPNIVGNIISGNATRLDGAGVFLEIDSAFISGNTISKNSAERDGGGLFSSAGSNPTVIDCIIWANGDDLCHCSTTYCCIEDPDEGEGNTHHDPMLVQGPLGDYYLDPESPCIDAGSQSAEDAGQSNLTTQADGAPDTGTVDMGFHYTIP